MTRPITVVNLTVHDIRVLDLDGGEHVLFPASGGLARITEIVHPAPPLVTAVGTVPTAAVAYATDVVGLPEPQPGVAYVVSRVLAAAVPRADLYFPQDEVRDMSGQIIGCRSLGRFLKSDLKQAAYA